MQSPPSWEETVCRLQQFIGQVRPGRYGLHITITLDNGDRVPMLLPQPAFPAGGMGGAGGAAPALATPAPPPAEVPAPQEEPPTFVPNAMQGDILAVLDGKAMRTDALAHAVGVNRSSLFRKPNGGMDELKREGYIDIHPRLGYYRLDAPPEELLGEESPQPQ